MAQRRISLQAERYGRSAYFLAARMEDDGSLVIEGQDLGTTPARVWGASEYEWEIAIAADDLPALVTALGGTPGVADPLDLLASEFAVDQRRATREFLEERGVPFEFWSRVGE